MSCTAVDRNCRSSRLALATGCFLKSLLTGKFRATAGSECRIIDLGSFLLALSERKVPRGRRLKGCFCSEIALGSLSASGSRLPASWRPGSY